MDTLSPELKDYLFKYCEHFMTENERMAIITIQTIHHATSEQKRVLMKEKGWMSDKPEVLAMITDGWGALQERIVNRLWTEHRQELPINRCPVCNQLARTPLARQCQHCFHKWH